MNNNGVLDERLVMEFNLKILKNIEPSVDSIECRIKYAKLYELDRAPKVWHESSIAGPLFLVSCKPDMRAKIIVLNQKNKMDPIEEIFPSMKFDFQSESQFLIFEDKNKVIKGIWSSDWEELTLLHKLILKKLKPLPSENNEKV
jgi:hypothetical protein